MKYQEKVQEEAKHSVLSIMNIYKQCSLHLLPISSYISLILPLHISSGIEPPLRTTSQVCLLLTHKGAACKKCISNNYKMTLICH